MKRAFAAKEGPLGRRPALALALLALPSFAAAAEAPEVDAAIRDAVGDGRSFAEGGLSIRAPAVADNGGQVPIAVLVDSPQTAALHVAAIHVFATRNPTPGVASFRLTPHVARAEVHTRIRLAADQRVIAVAVMSDGTLRRAAAEVRVGQGGCLT